MKTILLFGAGKSATVLIDYLIAEAPAAGWHIQVADADHKLATEKIKGAACATALSFDIRETATRSSYIQAASLVISLLPPQLHIEVARDCVQFGRNLLTASYVDDVTRELQSDIKEKGLTFLYEMGLDPGIDHMSAMKLIDEIHAKGGRITSFISHCGGLVAPESDDNPWHYKISWNPRNVVLAGKAGAVFREDGEIKRVPYTELFTGQKQVSIPGNGALGWYPNRDSLGYISLYGLEDTATFIRTTLRHPEFMSGWNNLIELKLTDETPVYDSDGKSLQELFREHMEQNGFGDWLNKKLTERFSQTKSLLEQLMKMTESATDASETYADSFLAADESGNLKEYKTEEVKLNAAGYLSEQMHDTNLILKQLFYLGLDDKETFVNKGKCSAADLLQFALEKKLVLHPDDRDMIVMLHEISYELSGKLHQMKSSLVVEGENSLRTAMAKTVGMPLGIAAKLILEGKIDEKGLLIPVTPAIYKPVLEALSGFGIQFQESET